MNILWQNEHYPDIVKGGGGAVNTRYIVSALQRIGHRAVVLARGPKDHAPYQEEIDSVTIQRMAPAKLPEKFWPLWALLEPRYAARGLQELIEPFDAFIGIDAWFALDIKRLRPGCPLIHRVEGSVKSQNAALKAARLDNHDGEMTLKQRWLTRLISAENEFIDQRAWKACDAIVVKSSFMKGELQKLYKVPASKIHVIPNGVDYRRFATATATREALLRLGNSDHKKIVILSCGRLVDMKNVSFLLRAFAKMKHGDETILAILGDGERRGSLESEAATLGLGAAVRFLGHSNHVEEYLAASDIFVLPSCYEPFGNSLVEAMSAALPAVALQPDGARIRTASAEIIEDGANGYLVDAIDPLDLARRLDDLVADPELRNRIGSRGQASCQSRFDWDKCAAAYLHLLETIKHEKSYGLSNVVASESSGVCRQ